MLLCKFNVIGYFLKGLLGVPNLGYFKFWSITFGCVVGLRVSNATFNAIVMRYSNRNGEVRFADFVACVIKLKTLFGKSRQVDSP